MITVDIALSEKSNGFRFRDPFSTFRCRQSRKYTGDASRVENRYAIRRESNFLRELEYVSRSIDDWYFQVMGGWGEIDDDDDNDSDDDEGDDDDNYTLPPMTSLTCWTTTKNLQDAVRTAFRIEYDLDTKSLHRWTIHAIQMIQDQQTMWNHSSVATTEQIRVTATSR